MSFFDVITGVKPAPPDGLPELPEEAPRGRRAAELLAAEQLQQLRIMHQSMTDLAAQLQGFLTNGLLAVETFQFDASATPMHRQFKAAIGAVDVRNLGSTAITVFEGGPAAGAPVTGRGVWVVPPGVRETIPINGTQFCVYGAAGDRLSYAAYTYEARPTS